MVASEFHSEPLSLRQLDEFLTRAGEEQWLKLALLGPEVSTHCVDEMVQDGWPIDRIFVLGAKLDIAEVRRVATLPDLIWLDLSHCGIGDAGASELTTLTCLTELSLRNNSIRTAGACGLTTLTGLTSLDLSNNRIRSEGVNGLATLKNLTSLCLSNNDIGAEGACCLGALTRLNQLNLSDNAIGAEGARGLSTLSGLMSLNLSNNKIGNDGACELSALTNLTSLNLSWNCISNHGACGLAALASLSSLIFSGNCIDANGARGLSPLTSLTHLILWGSLIGDDGARELVTLTKLTSLGLTGNKIGDEGARELAGLTNLTWLNLSDNIIGDEGACQLATLTKLTSLNLSNNRIGVDGARGLSRMTTLNSLHLQSNYIGDGGACSLSTLNCLSSLDLRSNGLGDNGACGLSTLKSLNSLDVSSNNIGVEGARGLGELTNLTWLDCRSNRIGDEGARGLSTLTHLSSLDLRSNDIGDEGARGLAKLKSLTLLNLASNRIGVEGACELAILTSLNSLDLSHCALQNFPRKLLVLPMLTKLHVYGNPIRDLRPELFENGIHFNCVAAARSHYSDLEQGAQADRELKVILLGNGRVGKTSIVRFLLKEPFDSNESTTHGIQLKVRMESLDDHDVRMNIWDFGGQDIYFNTHTLFLKSRAIFLIVWDNLTETLSHYTDQHGLQFDNRPLQYWLDYVQTFSPESSVIVVQNKCDDGAANEPPADLKGAKRTTFSAKHPELNGEVLIAMIRSASRSTLRNPDALKIGKGRWRVKQAIRRWQDEDNQRPPNEPRQHQLLTHAEFVALCEEQPGTVSSSEELLQFLHNTGVVYHDATTFHNQIILDQRWAIEAIYTIFHRDSCYRQLIKRGGRFTLSDLADLVWDAEEFSAEEQRLFLSFMQSCSICFNVGFDLKEPVYLAPQLLPARDELSPLVRAQLRDQLASVDKEIKCCCRYRHHFLHEGIMQKFMMRIGALFRDTAIYWRDGVQLKTDAHHAVAEVVCHHQLDRNPAHGEIVLTVWGDGRVEVLNDLRNEFARLHESHRGIEESVSLDGKTWLSLEDVRKSEMVNSVLPKHGETIDLGGLKFLLQRDPAPWLVKRFDDDTNATAVVPPTIYVSYAWEELSKSGSGSIEDIVDRVYDSLKADGFNVRRDKYDLPYKGNINAFMEEIGRAACIVVVVSDKSLRSPYCMFELLEMHRNLQFSDRIFPIVLPDAMLHSIEDRLMYIAHWKARYQKLEALVEQVGIDVLRSDGSIREYEKIKDIAHHADSLLTILGTMNTATPVRIEANDFELLKQVIVEQFQRIAKTTK